MMLSPPRPPRCTRASARACSRTSCSCGARARARLPLSLSVSSRRAKPASYFRARRRRRRHLRWVVANYVALSCVALGFLALHAAALFERGARTWDLLAPSQGGAACADGGQGGLIPCVFKYSSFDPSEASVYASLVVLLELGLVGLTLGKWVVEDRFAKARAAPRPRAFLSRRKRSSPSSLSLHDPSPLPLRLCLPADAPLARGRPGRDQVLARVPRRVGPRPAARGRGRRPAALARRAGRADARREPARRARRDARAVRHVFAVRAARARERHVLDRAGRRSRTRPLFSRNVPSLSL